MEGLKAIPVLALTLLIAGIIIAASVIMLGKFGDTLPSGKCFNSSFSIGNDDVCRNNTVFNFSVGGASNFGQTLGYGGNYTGEYQTIKLTKTGTNTISEQIPTVAIVAVMVVVISVIAGVFAYVNYFG